MSRPHNTTAEAALPASSPGTANETSPLTPVVRVVRTPMLSGAPTRATGGRDAVSGLDIDGMPTLSLGDRTDVPATFLATRSTSGGSGGSGGGDRSGLKVGGPARHRVPSGESGGRTPVGGAGGAAHLTPTVTVLAAGANPAAGVGMTAGRTTADAAAQASALRSQWEAAGGVVVGQLRRGDST